MEIREIPQKIPGVTAARPFGDRSKVQIEVSETTAVSEKILTAALEGSKFKFRKIERGN